MPSKPKITAFDPVNDTAISISNIAYDTVMAFAYLVTHIFFREVEISGLDKVPRKGPVVLVCAPHSNQFVDGAVVYEPIRRFLHRKVGGIVAEVSCNRRFIGTLAKLAGSIPVPRVQDNLKPAKGKIYVDINDISEDSEGDKVVDIRGKGTNFTKFELSGTIGLPDKLGNYKIKEIVDDQHLILSKPITNGDSIDALEDPISFKYCGKVDTNSTFQHVYNHLNNQGMIAIFPEGGSHDRTQLLPLKPGVGIMALGAVAAMTELDENAVVTVIPTGLHYFHPNKFRSRAVLEFGDPIILNKDDGFRYVTNPRQTTDKFLDLIKQALEAVTISAPDRETLQNIQAIRRLYKTTNDKPMNLPTVNETNRRLLIGWKHYSHDARIKKLFTSVSDYDKLIRQLGLKDHQIKAQNVNRSRFGTLKVVIHRVSKFVIFGGLSMPGLILFAPVFVLVNYYSRKKQAEALMHSSVKVKAIDVVASWKIIIATLAAPWFYVAYSLIATYYIRTLGISFLSNRFLLFFASYMFFVFMTYSSYRIGEVGVDIVKSLPPLFLQLLSKNYIVELKEYREKLSIEVTQACNELGPALFEDFDKFYAEGKPTIEEQHHKLHASSTVSFFSDSSSITSSYENVSKSVLME